MIVPKIKLPKRKRYNLYAIGDVHIGAYACDKQAFVDIIAKIKKDRNGFVILMGDLLDAVLAGDRRYNAYEADPDLITFKSQVDWTLAQLKPIRNKILGIIEGNHEEKIKKQVGYDFTEFMAEQLGCRYLHQSSMIHLETPWKTYKILAMHGIGGGATVGGQLNKIRRMIQNFYTAPDLVLVGHFHRLDSIVVPKMDDNMILKETHIGFTGCFYRTYVSGRPNYASDKWYSPSRIGGLRIALEEGNFSVNDFLP